MTKLVAAALLALVVCLPRSAAAADATPSFTKDVAPILYRSCVECHRPGRPTSAARPPNKPGMVFPEGVARLIRGQHDIVLNPRFVIPPNDGDFEVRGIATVTQDTVPRYDFNWQITCELAEPKVLPKGTRIEVIAHFDNSPANRFNPDPTQAVRWGDQTWDPCFPIPDSRSLI